MTMTADEVKQLQKKQEKKRGDGSKASYISVKDGEEILVRIGPPWVKDGEVWKDQLIHGGYKRKVFCANNDVDEKTNKKRKCLIERRLAELENDRSTRSKKLWGIIKQNARGLWNAAKVSKSHKVDGKYIVERYEDDKFKILELAGRWHSLLLDIFADDDLRDKSILSVADPKYGRLIKIRRRGSDTDTVYTFSAVTKATPIFEDKKKRHKMMDTLINLDKIVRGSSDEELTAFLHQAERDAKKSAKEEDNGKHSRSSSGSSSGSGSKSGSKSGSSSKSGSASKSKSASKSGSGSGSGSSSGSKSGSGSGSSSSSGDSKLERQYSEMKKKQKEKGGHHGSSSGSGSKSKSKSAS